MEGITAYSCKRCHRREPTLCALFRHFNACHGSESNWTCSLEGCSKSYKVYRSYRIHVSKCHKHFLTPNADMADQCAGRSGSSDPHPSTDMADRRAGTSGSSQSVVNEQSVCDAEPDLDSSCADPGDECAMCLSSLLLKWQEGKQLPEGAITGIANDIIDFFMAYKSSSIVDTSKIEQLRTKCGRERHWKRMYGFISPHTVNISTSQQASESYLDIPILDTIKAVATARNFFSEAELGISYSQGSDSMLLKDVTDGSYFREHCIFRNAKDQNLFILQLYFDEFEVCNPLGSKRGKHKVLGGYFTILNELPKTRSKLAEKYLVLLVKKSVVNKISLHQVVQLLLADIHHLEVHGVELSRKTVKGSVLYVSGDNLSSHQFGGFRECFSSGPICRFCMATREEINGKWHENEFTLRTKEMHARHAQLTQTDKSLSSVYGVSGESCMNALQSFDVVQGLPPDIMHDLFEGVIPFAMKHVISHLVTNNILTLDRLNQRLSSFSFQGADKKSKLPPFLIRQCTEKQ
ncbi:uncharacterized protein [Dermacentor andersoni]|uniref:uncharacterized protein n=1 Tax=Dermacentor andersoni TaxID=34620 RepID=UPI002415DF1F|nr:uncharacterized protein LOC129385924 [Dermacentor andersoni]